MPTEETPLESPPEPSKAISQRDRRAYIPPPGRKKIARVRKALRRRHAATLSWPITAAELLGDPGLHGYALQIARGEKKPSGWAAQKVLTRSREMAMWESDEELERLILPEIERHIGKENAVSPKELARMFDTSDRKVRAVVSALRTQGAPICSNTVNGFWWPRDLADFEEGIRTYRSQVGKMQMALLGAERGARMRFSKQGRLFSW